jgi:hypothetical protein
VKRIERAVAIVVSSRGDMSYPETEEEIQTLLNFFQHRSAVLVFRKDKEYPQVPLPPSKSLPLDLP